MKCIQTSSSRFTLAERYRVCVVTHTPDLGNTLCRLLTILGQETSVAFDGYEGLRLVLDTKPDAVITCMALSSLDGFQLASKIRDKFREKPVVIGHTSYCLSSIRAKAMDAGFDVLLAKHSRVENLLRALAFQRRQ